MKTLKIEMVVGREIIDSRGNPTVEADVILSDGTVGTGEAPAVLLQVSLKPWNYVTATNPVSEAKVSARP